MADSNVPAGLVKKETTYLVAAVCLLIGFLGGIVFTVFRSESGVATVSQEQAAGPQQPTAQQAQRMLALEQDVAANPSNTGAWIELGHLYFDTDEPQKAIKAYRRALELEPNNAPVWTDLGVMLRRAGQFEEALAAFEKAIELDPRLNQPRFNRGVVLMFDLNRPEEALASWEGLLAINPDAVAPTGQPLREFIRSHREKSGLEGK